MTPRRFAFALVLVLLSFGLLAQPSDRPNFTGVWKLDPGRSTFKQNAPESAILYIHQNDPDFHIRQTEIQHGKTSAGSAHGRTDGKTLDFKSHDGTKRTHMYWEGSQLVLEWESKDKHGQSQRTFRYSLSDDGKTLIAREDDENRKNEWVFNKKG